jgi:hypothetical protein
MNYNRLAGCIRQMGFRFLIILIIFLFKNSINNLICYSFLLIFFHAQLGRVKWRRRRRTDWAAVSTADC